MTVRVGFNRRLCDVQALDERLIPIPFQFQINGTSDPDHVYGDWIDTVVRTAAGEFTVTLKNKPAFAFGGSGTAEVGDTVDMVTRVNRAATVSAGTFIVTTQTGTTLTDPADDTIVHGTLWVKATNRKRTGT